MEYSLNCKKTILIDEEDLTLLEKYKWNICYFGRKNKIPYVRRVKTKPNRKSQTVLLHREIMNLVDNKNLYVDHINGDTLDNRKSNLRICSNAENSRNRKAPNLKKVSKYKGVSFYKKAKKWYSRIKVNYKTYCLGSFNTEKEAAIAYNEAAKKYFGEFAYLNVIDN